MNRPRVSPRSRSFFRKRAAPAFALCLSALVLLGGLNLTRVLDFAEAAQTLPSSPDRTQTQDRPTGRRPSRVNSNTSKSLDDLAEIVRTEGTVRVIVGLRVTFQPEGTINRAAITSQRSRIAQTRTALLSRLSPSSITAIKEFDFIPFVALEVDLPGFQQLRNAPETTAIELDAMLEPSLAESVPLIGAPTAWASGFSGAGQTVAVLDSGVDKNHTFLAGKVVSEACYSTNSSAQTSTVCPGGVTQSTASGSGIPCAVGGCNHGTHVAGIAAGQSASFSGVAKDASVIAIQVFSRVTGCAGSNCITAFTSDILLGMQRVQALSGSLSIAAVNLSLGGGTYGSTCDSSETAFKAGIDSLRAIGIATVIASGNNASNGGMSSPGCISTAVSVGSTADGSNGSVVDTISSFSNSASFLNLLAPGHWINSSVPGGGFAIFSGTSMATPHVAGAWAVLKSKTPNASVGQVLQALTDTGLPITDPRNGVVKPRIRVDQAVNALSPTACTYQTSTTSQSFAQVGGSTSVDITSDSGCSWVALSNVPWISFLGANSGIGNGSVSFSVAANPNLGREGTLFIAGQTFAATQSGIPVFAVDDGSFENASGLGAGGSSYRVNRLTPPSYPATINAVAIYFQGDTGVGIGNPLSVVAGVNASGSSNINGIQFASVSAVTVQVLDRFNIYAIPAMTINSGDFVVGVLMNHAAGVFPFAIDMDAPLNQRSYRSTNGTTFTIIDDVGTPGNYGLRAIPTQSITCPIVDSINPLSGLVGSVVTITGTGLSGVTAVKFPNNVNASFTINSDTNIIATVPIGTLSGSITLSTTGCADVQTAAFTVIGCPTMSGITPTSGIVGSSVIITGTNFTGVTAVKLSNNVNAAFTVDSVTQITATVPAGAVTGPITISRPLCSDIQTTSFTVITCPTVSGINPTSGIVGSNVVITGTNLTGVTAVRFSNNISAAFIVDNATQITATVSAGAVTGPITISRPLCSDIQTASFTVVTCPTLSGINPTSGIVGSNVVITGTNFTGVTAVKFSNNVHAAFTVDSTTQITATVPAGAVTGPITISRPLCSDIQTASFTVVTCPTLSGINPTSGIVGSNVVITGTNLTGVTAVRFSNNISAASIVDSATQITATVPAGAVTGPITISRPLCSDIQTASFTIITCPTVSGINPTSAIVGSNVVITGTNFTGVTAIKFSSNVHAAFTVDSTTQITATVPAGAVTGPITISRPLCSDIQTASFTVITCPTVSGINPTNGIVGSNVVITATNLTGVTAVRFSNNISAAFTVDNATQITATVPAGAVTGPITISRPLCSDIQTASFTVITCPIVSGINPTSGIIGSSVVITGTNLSGVSSVRFSNNVAASFVVNGATQITATVPAGAFTGVITISRPLCSDIQTASFTVVTCPTVSGINLTNGTVGSNVVITGTNFTGVTAVRFSNNVNAAFTVDGPTQITATVPAGAVTGPITISGPPCSDIQTALLSVAKSTNTGIFRDGFFWLLDDDGNQQFNTPPDRSFAFGGVAGDVAITGDWNGDGIDKIGIYRPSNALFILDYDGDTQLTDADKVYNLGVGTQTGDLPVVGDWNGDGRSKVGIFRQGFFWILDDNGSGTFEGGDRAFAFGGAPGDIPVVGDWTGSGTFKVGIVRLGFFWILDANGSGAFEGTGVNGDLAFAFGGIPGDVPVVGDWNGDGRSKVGMFRAGFFWVLDANGNQQFDGMGSGQDVAFAFGGILGDKPVVGKW